MSLGENIYNLRVEKNLSQGGLADALDVSRQSVSKWENNSAVPELDKLVKMAEIFGVTIDQLVTGQAPETTRAEQPSCESPASITDQAGRYARRTLGIVLVSFGLLTFLVFAVLSFLVDVVFESCILLSAPFVAAGLILALCRHNPGYYCSLLLYFPAFFIINILNHDSFGLIIAILNIALAIFALILLAWTNNHFRSDKLHMAQWGKILMIVFLCASTLISIVRLILCIFPTMGMLLSSCLSRIGS